MGLPASPFALGGFALSLLLALALGVAISMFVYILTFIMLTPLGARLLLGSAADFLSGLIVPLPLMPLGLQRALNVLPFRYQADFPFRLYIGDIAGQAALFGLIVQAAWLILLVLLGQIALRRCVAHAVIQGG